MRLLIVSDAWTPQVNGVVRTLCNTVAALRRFGHAVEMLTPDLFAALPCPTYPEIRLAVPEFGGIGRRITAIDPDAIHIATEGPLGILARHWCVRNEVAFSTAYHTDFPHYLYDRVGVPPFVTYSYLRWFHTRSSAVMVATAGLERELAARGFKRLKRWSRGVDTDLFRPGDKDELPFPRPVMLYAGRVAIEKNLEAFLRLNLPGTKVVVGRGPQLGALSARYPETRFLGFREGEALARAYAAADVFVFPSRTDTFGLVLLEALASGVPVAAYPVTGPLDVIGDAPVGCLDEDLATAIRGAMGRSPAACRAHAQGFSWEAGTHQFLANIIPRRAIESRRVA